MLRRRMETFSSPSRPPWVLQGAGLEEELSEGFGIPLEPAPHYSPVVTEAFERLLNAIGPEEINSPWDEFIAVASAELSGLPQGDPARGLLDRIAGKDELTSRQQEVLRTTARRVVRAFHPDLEGARLEEYVGFLLSVTRPTSTESLRPFLPLRILWLRERQENGESLDALTGHILPKRGDFLGTDRFWDHWGDYRRTGNPFHLGQVPPGSISLFLTPPDSQDALGLVSVGAHEYAHFLLEEWERFEGKGQTDWHREHESLGQSTAHTDWITNGLAGVMKGWVALDRSEAIPMPKAVDVWLSKKAKQWVFGSAGPSPAELASLENLPSEVRRYVQGDLAGEVAEAVGREIVSRRGGGNPYEPAASFLGWYAKRPWSEDSPSLQELVFAARDFIAERAGLEGQFPEPVPVAIDDFPFTFVNRWPLQMRLLQEEILPQLISSRERPVRLLSIGSASGEEPATLAEVTKQAFEKERGISRLGDWEIIGLEKDPSAIGKAEKRVFTGEDHLRYRTGPEYGGLDRAQEIVKILNGFSQDQRRRSIRFIQQDATAPEARSWFKQADVVLINNLTLESEERLGGLLKISEHLKLTRGWILTTERDLALTWGTLPYEWIDAGGTVFFLRPPLEGDLSFAEEPEWIEGRVQAVSEAVEKFSSSQEDFLNHLLSLLSPAWERLPEMLDFKRDQEAVYLGLLDVAGRRVQSKSVRLPLSTVAVLQEGLRKYGERLPRLVWDGVSTIYTRIPREDSDWVDKHLNRPPAIHPEERLWSYLERLAFWGIALVGDRRMPSMYISVGDAVRSEGREFPSGLSPEGVRTMLTALMDAVTRTRGASMDDSARGWIDRVSADSAESRGLQIAVRLHATPPVDQRGSQAGLEQGPAVDHGLWAAELGPVQVPVVNQSPLLEAVENFRVEQRTGFSIETAGFLLEEEGLAFAPILALLETRGVFPDPRFAGIVDTSEEKKRLLEAFAEVEEVRELLEQRLVAVDEQPGATDEERRSIAEYRARIHLMGLTIRKIDRLEWDWVAQLDRILATVGYLLPEDRSVRDAAWALLTAA